MAKKEKKKAKEYLKFERPKNYMRNRMLAVVIDFLIIGFGLQLIFYFFGTPDWQAYLASSEIVRGLPANNPLVVERLQLYWHCLLVSLFVSTIYEIFMLLFFGGTVGKLVFGLRIVDSKPTRKLWLHRLLLIWRCVLRALSLAILNGIPFLLLCFGAYGNRDMFSGFDVFSGTRVIDVRSLNNENNS